MRRHFPIVIEQDSDGVFIVECPAFQGCRSYGHTIDDALGNVRVAIQACFEESPPEEDMTFVGVRDQGSDCGMSNIPAVSFNQVTSLFEYLGWSESDNAGRTFGLLTRTAARPQSLTIDTKTFQRVSSPRLSGTT